MNRNVLDGNVGQNDFTDSVRTYYKELERYSPISREEERELMIKAKEGDIDARNMIITSNLRFVFEIAKKYRGRGVDIADLISEGNKGVIKAIEKFDMSKDVKFFTYAVWWIRQHMMSLINERMEETRNEVSFDDEFPSENRGIDNMGGDSESDDEFYFSGNDISDGEEGDFNNACDEEMQKQFVVHKLLAKLDERERVIVMKYFGLDNGEKGMSFEEISKEMNISTERVRQIKIKAINSMRAEVFNMEEANFLF